MSVYIDRPLVFSDRTLRLPHCTLRGEIRYFRSSSMLELISSTTGDSEVLSVDLVSHGYVATSGQVWIKDWSEHAGLAHALVEAGVITTIHHVTVGPFGSKAYLGLVLTDAVLGR